MCNYSYLAVAELVEDVYQPGVGEAGGNVTRTEHPALGSGSFLSPPHPHRSHRRHHSHHV